MDNEEELEFLHQCLREGRHIRGVNSLLQEMNIFVEVSSLKYIHVARDYSKKHSMQQRNIDAIAWQGKGI